MLKARVIVSTLALLLWLASQAEAQSRFTVDFETGAAVSGYNDVRIPGDTGTLFSLTDDLQSDTALFWRLCATIQVAQKHGISLLAAPLRINASGTFDRPVFFVDTVFPAGTPVTGRYVFDSYRVTYRYEVVQGSEWRVGIGVTGKIRNALTRLTSASADAEKTNVGFVPLVNFKIERALGTRVWLTIEGDALAAPQGRAEDVFVGVVVPVNRRLSVKAGYRFLEGGADVDEVYTFALVHYAAIGAIVHF
jgi:hypothetical protein